MRKYIFYSVVLFILSLIIISCFESKSFNNEIIIYPRDKAAHDGFGQAFSISGKYLIVGAGNVNSNQGQVFIFKNTGNNNWNEVTKLEASDKSENDLFGYSVSVFGKHAIVGAPGCDSNSGQVYIFKHVDADNWKEVTILTSKFPVKINKHFFGCSVSIDGNYAIVGASSFGEDTGLTYVFKNDGADNWKEIERFRSGDTISDDSFGYSVSIYKDYAIIGAPSADSGGNNRGQSYIFKNDGADNWNKIAILTASDQEDDAFFGRSVLIYEDYAIVGDPLNNSGGKDRGQAYIFKNDGADNWKETAILTPGVHYDNYYFGHSVSAFDKHVIVGAPGSGSNQKKGQVYIFKNVGADNWKEINILKPGDPYYFHFGLSVSISGKYAMSNALVRASDGRRRGQVYIFY